MTKSKKVKREDPKKAKQCRACEINSGQTCPFCTKEGLVLIALAIILIAWNNSYTRYLAWALLLAAFFVPLVKNALTKQK